MNSEKSSSPHLHFFITGVALPKYRHQKGASFDTVNPLFPKSHLCDDLTVLVI